MHFQVSQILPKTTTVLALSNALLLQNIKRKYRTNDMQLFYITVQTQLGALM